MIKSNHSLGLAHIMAPADRDFSNRTSLLQTTLRDMNLINLGKTPRLMNVQCTAMTPTES